MNRTNRTATTTRTRLLRSLCRRCTTVRQRTPGRGRQTRRRRDAVSASRPRPMSFTKTADGGTQRVVAKKAADAAGRAWCGSTCARSRRSSEGRFLRARSHPWRRHARAGAAQDGWPGEIAIRYRNVDGGAELSYRTRECRPGLRAACMVRCPGLGPRRRCHGRPRHHHGGMHQIPDSPFINPDQEIAMSHYVFGKPVAMAFDAGSATHHRGARRRSASAS